MIRSFKHKGLKRFFESGSASGIRSSHSTRLRMQLSALDTALSVQDMDIPGYRLHQLSGSRRGIWAISVSGNWRVTFKFIEGDAYIVNYEDYH
jgi:proteic killer suppression protein